MFTGEDDIYKVKAFIHISQLSWSAHAGGSDQSLERGGKPWESLSSTLRQARRQCWRVLPSGSGEVGNCTETGVHKYFQDKTSISYFTPDLCRPIHFNFKEETEVMGVAGYKYMLDEGFVANSTFNVTNGCYNPELDLVVDIPVRIFLSYFCLFTLLLFRSIA